MPQDTALPYSRHRQDLQQLRQQWLKVLFSIGALAISALWMSEALIRHEVNLLDQVAYPLLLLSITSALLLLHWRPHAYNLAVVGTVGAMVVYNLTFLQAIIWDYLPVRDHYTLATFSQWFPLTYTIIFLFIEQKWAILLSGAIYISLAVPSLVFGWLERDLPGQEQIFPYLLHLMLSHPIYIVVFTAMAMLQTSFAQAQAQAVMADIDSLTNLANRRAATRALDAALAPADQSLTTGVMLVDIDRFKTINDTFGHGVGDRVLIQVAQLLQQELRKTDIAARWGGEEFLIVLTPTTPEQLYEAAERLRSHLSQYPHPQVGQVTASFGIALREAEESLEALLHRADQALYKAKAQGRNQVVVATARVVLASA